MYVAMQQVAIQDQVCQGLPRDQDARLQTTVGHYDLARGRYLFRRTFQIERIVHN